jgi:phosphoserine phosphatase
VSAALPTVDWLVVDLDGTLVRTDTLHETFLGLMLRRPWALLPLSWLLLTQGRAPLKGWLARAVPLDVATLPYRKEVIDLVLEARRRGIATMLATAADRRIADAVAEHLGLFDAVLATDGHDNLKGARKRDAIRARIGTACYAYIGDSSADLPIWHDAEYAIVAGGRPGLAARASGAARPAMSVGGRSPALPAFVSTLRPSPWIGNLTVLVPMLVAPESDGMSIAMASTAALVSFCLIATGARLVAHLCERSADRAHARRRHRPFASGDTPLAWGLVGAPLLTFAGLGVGLTLGPTFIVCAGVFLALGLARGAAPAPYGTAQLAAQAALDTTRMLAGSAAVGLPPTPALLGLAALAGLGLALAKRAATPSRNAPRSDE